MRRFVCLMGSSVAALLLVALGIPATPVHAAAEPGATRIETPAGQPLYVIGIGDVVDIHVWRDPDLSRQGVIVRPDGRISLPLVGDVQASGLTAPALSGIVEDKLREFVNEPHVTVIIQTINSYRVYVLGHVSKAGVYTFQSPTRLVEALATAGGFDQFADTTHIVVLSSRGTGAQTRIEVDFKKIASGARLDDNIYLRPSDTVIVP